MPVRTSAGSGMPRHADWGFRLVAWRVVANDAAFGERAPTMGLPWNGSVSTMRR